ncbi:hypothetical protein D3C85_1500910 [compost metagenome]
MLVLAHADRLRIDLHEFSQRVLQAAGDRHRAAQRHVKLRELLGGQLGSRVDRGAGLADHDLGQLQFRGALHQVLHQLVGLAAGRAVADGGQRHVVLFRQAGQCGQRAFPVAARLVRVDRGGVQQLAGMVDHGDLAAGADARVDAHH